MSEFPEGYGDWTWGELEDFARGLMEKVAVLEGACRHGIAYDVHCPDCADGGRGFCACPECEGVSDEPRYVLNSDGWQPAPDVDQACSHCGGDGEIAKPGVPYSYAIICKTCAGTGRGPAGVPDVAATEIPLCQPGDTKILRITLTEEDWWTLAARAVATPCKTLQDIVNDIVREGARA